MDLPTILTHSVVAVSSAYGFSSGKESLKFWILSIACSSLPDADVIGYRWLYIPSYHFFGHRGFLHSPFFAALLSILKDLSLAVGARSPGNDHKD